MTKALERKSSWKARATHTRAMCLSLEHHGRDFPFDDRDLVGFMGFLYTYLLQKKGPLIAAASVPNYVSGITKA